MSGINTQAAIDIINEQAKEIATLKAQLREVADNGLIYWEPKTATGATRRSLMFADIERALSKPGDSK